MRDSVCPHSVEHATCLVRKGYRKGVGVCCASVHPLSSNLTQRAVMPRQLVSNEGELFELHEDESALCIMLEGDDAGSAPVPVYGANPNEGPLSSVRLRSVVELLTATIKLLPPSMPPSEREALRTQGLPHTNSDPTAFESNVHGIPGDIRQISRLLGDIRWLDCPLPKSNA